MNWHHILWIPHSNTTNMAKKCNKNHNVLVEIEGNGPNWRGWELKRREASHMAFIVQLHMSCPLSTLNSTFFNPTHNLNLDLTKENYYFFLLNNVAPCPLTGKTGRCSRRLDRAKFSRTGPWAPWLGKHHTNMDHTCRPAHRMCRALSTQNSHIYLLILIL